jgi:hypothetical protein
MSDCGGRYEIEGLPRDCMLQYMCSTCRVEGHGVSIALLFEKELTGRSDNVPPICFARLWDQTVIVHGMNLRYNEAWFISRQRRAEDSVGPSCTEGCNVYRGVQAGPVFSSKWGDVS